MRHLILIGTDLVGEFPWHVRDEEALPTGDVRWRLVGETEDDAEAVRLMGEAGRRCREEVGGGQGEGHGPSGRSAGREAPRQRRRDTIAALSLEGPKRRTLRHR